MTIRNVFDQFDLLASIRATKALQREEPASVQGPKPLPIRFSREEMDRLRSDHIDAVRPAIKKLDHLTAEAYANARNIFSN